MSSTLVLILVTFQKVGGMPPGSSRLAKKQLRQSDILVFEYIAEYVEANGHPPTYREILQGTGLSSTSVVGTRLKALALTGHIDWKPGAARTLRIIAWPEGASRA